MFNSIRKIAKDTDWILLIFLVLFLNQSNFSLKTVGLLFIYILRPNFKFGFFKGRMPKFYLFIIGLGLLNLVINIHDFSIPYMAAFGMSATLWIFGILAYHQLRLSVERNGEKNNSTFRVFAVLNLVVCLVQLIKIMLITGTINPYRGLAFPYGLSTGDNLYGIVLQNSYYNVMISSFLAVYFLFKRDIIFCLISVTAIILVFANTGTLIFVTSFVLILAAGFISALLKKTGRLQGLNNSIVKLVPSGRFYVSICLVFTYIVALSYVISPENVSYTVTSFLSKIHQGINGKDKVKLYAIEKKVNEIKEQEKERNLVKDTASVDTSYKQLIGEKEKMSQEYVHKFKGKKLSMLETSMYLKSSVQAFLFGSGPVRFSSLTAQKMSGYDSSRIFQKILPRYTSSLYRENHRLIIKARVDSTPEYWSTINAPDSFYNQILGEYGILGVLLFLVFYVWFFMARIKYWSYGFWLSVLLLPFAFLSYMFEPFAPIVFYELLMETDIKNNKEEGAIR